MEKFLELAYMTQIMDMESNEQYFEPLTAKMREVLSEDVCKDLEEVLWDCACECVRHFGLQGMKLAIGIIDGTYTPIV
jgi:hypothetical protein